MLSPQENEGGILLNENINPIPVAPVVPEATVVMPVTVVEPTQSQFQPVQTQSVPVVNQSSSVLKYFFVITGIILIVGFGFWKYKQNKNSEVGMSGLPAFLATTAPESILVDLIVATSSDLSIVKEIDKKLEICQDISITFSEKNTEVKGMKQKSAVYTKKINDNGNLVCRLFMRNFVYKDISEVLKLSSSEFKYLEKALVTDEVLAYNKRVDSCDYLYENWKDIGNEIGMIITDGLIKNSVAKNCTALMKNPSELTQEEYKSAKDGYQRLIITGSSANSLNDSFVSTATTLTAKTGGEVVINGKAFKGLILNAKVRAIELIDGKMSSIKKDVEIDKLGNFSVSMPKGIILLQVITRNGSIEKDEKLGVDVPLPINFSFRAAVDLTDVTAKSVDINITAYSEVAVLLAIKAGGLSQTNINRANSGISSIIGVDFLSTKMIQSNDVAGLTTATKAEKQMSVLNAAISEMASTDKMGCGAMPTYGEIINCTIAKFANEFSASGW
ncbi:MAG: hypothetical protein NTW35_00655 [Candidatus Nomurabacteria bacterium]|nr:hypothetical protein [Candidatus Nomurabacteria bacterium]